MTLPHPAKLRQHRRRYIVAKCFRTIEDGSVAIIEPSRRVRDSLTLRADVLKVFEAALDEKLRWVRPGQGLGVAFDLFVIHGDLSPEGEPDDRHTPEYVAWRTAVYERDRFTCVLCGERGKIQAHHRQAFSTHPELRYEVSNGITVCPPCHAHYHPSRAALILASKARRQRRETSRTADEVHG